MSQKAVANEFHNGLHLLEPYSKWAYGLYIRIILSADHCHPHETSENPQGFKLPAQLLRHNGSCMHLASNKISSHRHPSSLGRLLDD